MKKIFLSAAVALFLMLTITPVEANTHMTEINPTIQPRFFMNLETDMIASKSNQVDVRVKFVYHDGYNQIQTVTGISEISYYNGSAVAADPVVTDYNFSNNRRTCTVDFTYKLYENNSSKYKIVSDSVTFSA